MNIFIARKKYFNISNFFYTTFNAEAQNNIKTIDSLMSGDFTKVQVETSFSGGLKK